MINEITIDLLTNSIKPDVPDFKNLTNTELVMFKAYLDELQRAIVHEECIRFASK